MEIMQNKVVTSHTLHCVDWENNIHIVRLMSTESAESVQKFINIFASTDMALYF